MEKIRDFWEKNWKTITCYLISAWLITDGIILYLYQDVWVNLTWVNQVNNVLYLVLFLFVLGVVILYGVRLLKNRQPWYFLVAALIFYGVSLILKGGLL